MSNKLFDKLDKIKKKALKEIDWIEEEHYQMRKNLSESNVFMSQNNEEIRELYMERKDRKYASLVVELYALVEQTLKDFYATLKKEEYEKERNKNVIVDLESKLSEQLNFKNVDGFRKFTEIRNYIIHDAFSLKKARKNNEINMKSSELFLSLLEVCRGYIQGINAKS
ncbi:hypothetical protein [Brevibacillus agri]|uniref:hypothetical protein n=1 Tax=Brevibacillus agri TaxID=51101 RepID=UPI003D7580AD